MTSRKRGSKAIVIGSGGTHVVSLANAAYVFEIAGSVKMASMGSLPVQTKDSFESQPLRISGYDIVPCGESNLLPTEMRDLFEANNLVEGIFKRQRGLLWGQGPGIYKEVKVDGEPQRVWVDIPEITDWLESFDYEEQLSRAIVDYYHMEGHFTKFWPDRAGRIGDKSKILSVQHVGYHLCRLEWAKFGDPAKRIIYGDWQLPKINGCKPYPVFDPANTNPISLGFYNMYSFGRNTYGLPAHFGTMDWINRGSAIPRILESLTKNSLNVKWHIISPQSYWMAKRDELIRQCGDNPETVYTESMLEDFKEKTYKKLAEVLSGETNVGKFFTSEQVVNELGNLDSWKIEAIDQKVKEFVESQIMISKQAESATVSGMGLHPSLANIIVDGKLASGSEQLYALKLYLSTEIAIPERIICKPINQALKINFPNEKVKVGFYHEVVQTEDATTPKDRIKNVV